MPGKEVRDHRKIDLKSSENRFHINSLENIASFRWTRFCEISWLNRRISFSMEFIFSAGGSDDLRCRRGTLGGFIHARHVPPIVQPKGRNHGFRS